MNRIYTLDYLRGLAAFGIMIYHYLAWSLGEYTSDTLLGRFGVYGVSIFYVLSGLTLYYVYYDKMKPSKDDLALFFRKRFFRIFPLLWLVTIIAIILSQQPLDITKLALNLSGLFGFIRWDEYFATGAWSIGNELVFYVFFPFFILFTKKFKPLMLFLTIALLAIYVYFAFVRLNPDLPLTEQWKHYTNPLNQVFLFLGGFLAGFFFHKLQIKDSIVLILFMIGLAIFAFYPASGDRIQIVTGLNRLVFTACCFLICICCYKLTFQAPNFIHQPLVLLGEASYSVYLLHPIVYDSLGLLRDNTFHFPESIRLILALLTTLIASYFVYQNFEKYFMKLGRKKKIAPQNTSV